MAFEEIKTSESNAAENIAKQIVGQIVSTAARIVQLRKTGVPAVEAQPASQLPDGRVIPARPAATAITPEMIDEKLGAKNVAILNALSQAME